MIGRCCARLRSNACRADGWWRWLPAKRWPRCASPCHSVSIAGRWLLQIATAARRRVGDVGPSEPPAAPRRALVGGRGLVDRVARDPWTQRDRRLDLGSSCARRRPDARDDMSVRLDRGGRRRDRSRGRRSSSTVAAPMTSPHYAASAFGSMPQERIVIRGPSGSGKSTLVAALTGQVRASAGRVRLFGHDIAQTRPRRGGRAANCAPGRCQPTFGSRPHRRSRLSRQRRSAVAIGRYRPSQQANGRRAAALERLGLDHLARRRPASLSGGERQRVALAAALAHGPGSGDRRRAHRRARRDQRRPGVRLPPRTRRADGRRPFVVTHDDAPSGSPLGCSRSTMAVSAKSRSTGVRHWSSTAAAGSGCRIRCEPTRGSPAERWHRQTKDTSACSDPSTVAPPTTCSPRPAYNVGSVAVGLCDAAIDLGSTTVGPVSMELRRGELTVITGRSGSGKTTLLSLVMGLVQPTRGAVDGTLNPSPVHPRPLPSPISRVCTPTSIWRWRCVPNRPTAASRVLLDSLGLGDLRRPSGRRPFRRRAPATGVGTGLVVEADCVALDEPTSQLDRGYGTPDLECDPQGMRDGGACVVCASHDEELIAVADQLSWTSEGATRGRGLLDSRNRHPVGFRRVSVLGGVLSVACGGEPIGKPVGVSPFVYRGEKPNMPTKGRTMRLKKASALFIALAVVGVACGDDSNSRSGATNAPAGSAAPGGTTAPAAAGGRLPRPAGNWSSRPTFRSRALARCFDRHQQRGSRCSSSRRVARLVTTRHAEDVRRLHRSQGRLGRRDVRQERQRPRGQQLRGRRHGYLQLWLRQDRGSGPQPGPEWPDVDGLARQHQPRPDQGLGSGRA